MNRRLFAAMVSAVSLAGCAALAMPSSPSPVTTSTTAALQNTAATLAYPGSDGYTATIVTGPNTAPAGTTATLTTIANPPASLAPMDAPPGTLLIAYELTLTQDVTFNVWNGFVSSIDLPPSIEPAGRTFANYGYDLTAGVASGNDLGTVNGSTVSFPANRLPTTLKANHTYLMILSMQ